VDNEQILANAIRSLTLANVLTWHAVAQLLDSKRVCSKAEFAETAATIARILQYGLDGTEADKTLIGAEMLTTLHDQLKGIKPRPPEPAWTPRVVQGKQSLTPPEGGGTG